MAHPMQDHREFIAHYAALLKQARALPPPPPPPPLLPPLADNPPTILLCSPHPDDETLTGGFPLRLRREAGCRIINLPITLGSDPARRAARKEELNAACNWLGFDCLPPPAAWPGRLTPDTRGEQPAIWQQAVQTIAAHLGSMKPKAIAYPHGGDAHPAHAATFRLVHDALAALPDWTGLLVETGYWTPLPSPNLLVESTPEDVAILTSALACHAGETRRNPYHLSLSAGMVEAVCRGSEQLRGAGAQACDALFGTLYRVRMRKENWRAGAFLSCRDNLPDVVLVS